MALDDQVTHTDISHLGQQDLDRKQGLEHKEGQILTVSDKEIENELI